MEQRHACVNCLRESAVVLRLDRRRRPFTYCGFCQTRSFIPSPDGLAGLVLLAPTVGALIRQLGAAGLTQVHLHARNLIDSTATAAGGAR